MRGPTPKPSGAFSSSPPAGADVTAFAPPRPRRGERLAERQDLDAALVATIERHEAAVWSRCFRAAAALPGDPLGVVWQAMPGWPSLSLSAAVDSYEINRLLGLGVTKPATPEIVEATTGFYRSHGRTRFRVELAPTASPAELPRWLEQAGLRLAPNATTKMVRATGDISPPRTDVGVRELDPTHRNAVGKLNALAWGAPSDERSIRWFGATVGAPGFRHYGVFQDGRLISTGALVVDEPIGWVGFAATHPRHRGRGLREEINRVRLSEAQRLGCDMVHVEIDSRYSGSAKLPFDQLYDRPFYASVPEDEGARPDRP